MIDYLSKEIIRLFIQEIAEWVSKREGEPVGAVNRELEQFLNVLPEEEVARIGNILIILTAQNSLSSC